MAVINGQKQKIWKFLVPDKEIFDILNLSFSGFKIIKTMLLSKDIMSFLLLLTKDKVDINIFLYYNTKY